MKKIVCFTILLSLMLSLFACNTTPDSENKGNEEDNSVAQTTATPDVDVGKEFVTDPDSNETGPLQSKMTPFSQLTTPVPANIPFHLKEGETVESSTAFAVEGNANGKPELFIARVAILNTPNNPNIGKFFQIELLDRNYAYLDHLRFAGVGFVVASRCRITVYHLHCNENQEFFMGCGEYAALDFSIIGTKEEKYETAKWIIDRGKTASGGIATKASIAKSKPDFILVSNTTAGYLQNFLSYSILPLVCMTCTMEDCRVYTAENAPELTNEFLKRFEDYTIDQFAKDMQIKSVNP